MPLTYWPFTNQMTTTTSSATTIVTPIDAWRIYQGSQTRPSGWGLGTLYTGLSPFAPIYWAGSEQEQVQAYAQQRYAMEAQLLPGLAPRRDLVGEPAIIVDLAKKRAEELLLSHLNPDQIKTFLDHRYFEVIGGRTKTRYRIHNTGHVVANVEVIDNGGRGLHRLCAHAPSRLGLPHADQLLAQKIGLELDEEDFLRVANRHAPYRVHH